MNDRWHSFEASFGGINAAQYWCDFILWEALLNDHAETRGIVELGTWKGGFSLYLASQARIRGLSFRTYDVQLPEREIPGFVRLDIFAEYKRIGNYIRRVEPVILFCDNGNKPRELATFPQYIRDRRSIIVVHDWMTEVLPKDVPDLLEPIHEEYCDNLGSISRVFKIRGL